MLTPPINKNQSGMKNKDFDSRSFKDRLDAFHDWPCGYTFKFIVPAAAEREIKNILDELLDEAEFSVRASSQGRWVSVTATAVLGSAEEVLEVYESLGGLEGVIAL